MRGVEWIPVRAAAKMLHVSKQRVHQLMAQGALAKIDYDGTVLVSLGSILARVNAQKLLGLDGKGG